MSGMAREERPVPEVPSHLSGRSAALWHAVVPSRAKSPERLALVVAALDALDLADECRERVRTEGLTATTKGSGTIHAHPLVKVEEGQRALFTRIWCQLNLSWNQSIDGRM